MDKVDSGSSPITPGQPEKPGEEAKKEPVGVTKKVDDVVQEHFAVPTPPPAPAPHKITISEKFLSKEYAEKFQKHEQTLGNTREKLAALDAEIAKKQLAQAHTEYMDDHPEPIKQEEPQKTQQQTRTASQKTGKPQGLPKTKEQHQSEPTKAQETARGSHATEKTLAAELKIDQEQAESNKKKYEQRAKELHDKKVEKAEDNKTIEKRVEKQQQ